MRTRPYLLALSPLALALASACMPVAAQDATPTPSPGLTQPTSAAQQVVPDAGQLPAGLAAAPTVASPGLVTGITLGELYTDNVRLTGDGESKDGRFITVVKPFMKAAWNSPRLTGVFDAALNGYLYAGHSDENQVAGHLNTHGTLAMLPQHLYLDGAASYGRQIINNAAPAGGTFFLGNNRANVATAML
ncbi:MAG TPA: TIGR03016 family PEP-CTERM system-associated outer membrane protein, partial [Oleiagrimonas sp.]|nr:TIGR03016 family PEP-CTERM system-associated outer membrane protein [Oleiagrimonas sp.]